MEPFGLEGRLKAREGETACRSRGRGVVNELGPVRGARVRCLSISGFIHVTEFLIRHHLREEGFTLACSVREPSSS